MIAAVMAGIAVTVVALQMAAPAAAWTPETARYGIVEERNVPVTMSDGTVIETNVYEPADAGGKPAPGPFPVILSQTPYGKDDGGGSSQLAELAGVSDYLVQRGYIQVVADVRGTGGSEGEWGLFDPVQGHDGATLVDFAANLPHSDGDIGLLGASYLGINQFATAADAGGAHVKAMFPIIAGNDLYRDTAFAGGFPDLEFSAFYLGFTGVLNSVLPFAEGNRTLAAAFQQHVKDLSDFDANLVAGVETGGGDAYDQTYWGERNPVQFIPQIVKDGIPAFLVGGWYDLFQRGEPLNYASFQDAYDRRPVLSPMTATQPVTPRYQLLMGPWYHVTAGDGLDYHGLDLDGVELAWFDHWLKGVDTGITDTTTPLHLEDLSDGRYLEASRYPLDQATPTTYYLQPSGGLSTAKPSSSAGADHILFTGSEVPCTSSTEQWAAGLGALALQYLGLQDPCTQNASLSQLGPGTVSYTTAPFTHPTTLSGPIGASLYATSTTKDTEFVVQLTDVAPNGTASALTSGLLEGSQRALDGARTWYAPDGRPLLPYHPYTKAAEQAVTPGQVTRYDVEVFPTTDTLRPGHRLRVTIATSDFPHAVPTLIQLPSLLGGVYGIEHTASAPSSIELPLVAGTANEPTGLPQAASGPLACPRPTGRLAGTALGPVRLGMTRARAQAAFAASSTRGHADMEFFCLTPNGIRVGFPSAKLLARLPSTERAGERGRVIIALTANRAYALRGVRPGTSLRSAAARLGVRGGVRIGRNTWYLVPAGAARGVLKVTRGTIEEVGIAMRSLTATAKLARTFLSSFS
jgi:putative CocE/NonD family hydrolase